MATGKGRALAVAVVVVVIIIVAIAAIAFNATQTPASTAPGINISGPQNGSTVGENVTVTVSVSHFTLVNLLGQANVPGEGHVIYYLDVTPPTISGVPATTAPGTFIATANTSATWEGLSLGSHTLSVQLVNNDHTPLQPSVVKTVSVTVQALGPPITVFVQAHNIAFNVSTVTVPANAQVTVVFFNNDPGLPHTFSVYTDSTATTAIFVSPEVTGVTTATFHFNAPSTPGTYFFRCDIHFASGMTGSFVVT